MLFPGIKVNMIYIGEKDRAWCEAWGEILFRSKKNLRDGDGNTPNSVDYFRGRGLPPYYRNYVGALGEFAYSVHSGLEPNYELFDDYVGDDGSDFSNGVQVKTTTAKNPRLTFRVDQYNRKWANRYVLAYVNPEINPYLIVLVGWASRITIERYKHREDYQDKDTKKITKNWVLENNHLKPLGDFEKTKI